MENKKEAYDWNGIQREIPEWFMDAKFGLFFHWGPYSVPAYKTEWYSRTMYEKGTDIYEYHKKKYGDVSKFGYKDFYDQMTGEKFDADEWADLVVRSGAKYAGPVTEHADNFAMWDSKVNPANSVNYGPHRDITGECAEAFRKRGIKVLSTFHHQWLWGWFMSDDMKADVYDPENEKFYGPSTSYDTHDFEPRHYPDKRFNENWLAKVNEVVDKYNPDVLYFDSRTYIIGEKQRYEMAKFYNGHPECKNGVITYKNHDLPVGTGVYDIEVGHFTKCQPYYWQTDEHLENNFNEWCMVQDPKYRSAKRVIIELADVVARNGALLLNVGPYADGSFHAEAKKVLYSVGDWLKINGEAIYATRPYRASAEYSDKKVKQSLEYEALPAQIVRLKMAESQYLKKL